MLKVYQRNITPLYKEAAFDEKLNILGKECRDRILSYKIPDDRCRSLGAFSLLYEGLMELGIKREAIRITRDEIGKPGLLPAAGLKPLYFNLSHAGEMAVCAISDSEVGCDIEKLDRFADREYKSLERIARRVMTENEYGLWLKEPTGEALVKLWTKKESYAKYTGEGLSCDFSKVDTLDPERFSHPDTEAGYYLTIFT